MALFLSGCSTTLQMARGAEISGDLERADDNHLYMVLDEPAPTTYDTRVRAHYTEVLNGPDGERGKKRRLYRVPRAAVADVHLPGRGVAIAGTVLTTIGLIPMLAGVVAVARCGGGLCNIIHVFSTIPGSVVANVGIPMMISGWVIYANGANDVALPKPQLSVAPFVDPRGENSRGGIAAVMTW